MLRKTRTLDRLEQKMSVVAEDSLRFEILSCAKNFKSSWIELGKYLLTVQRDKLYKSWGYLTFEAYCTKEISIRRQTAVKLLRSYYFLEQEESDYLKRDYLQTVETNKIPSCETIHTLRQAKSNKDLSIADYERIKRNIFEDGKQDKEIKDVYRQMVKAVEDQDDPEEARKKRRLEYVRRIIGSLNSLRKEAEINKFLSGAVVSDLQKLISRIEKELNLTGAK